MRLRMELRLRLMRLSHFSEINDIQFSIKIGLKIGWRLNIENFFMKFTDSMWFKVCLSLAFHAPNFHLCTVRVSSTCRKKTTRHRRCVLCFHRRFWSLPQLWWSTSDWCAPHRCSTVVAPGNGQGEWQWILGDHLLRLDRYFCCCMLWQELSLCWEQAGLFQSTNTEVLSLRNSVNTWKILEDLMILMIFPPGILLYTVLSRRWNLENLAVSAVSCRYRHSWSKRSGSL